MATTRKKPLPRKRKTPVTPLLTVEEIDSLFADSARIWRNREPMARKRGLPVKPGAVRAFVHSY